MIALKSLLSLSSIIIASNSIHAFTFQSSSLTSSPTKVLFATAASIHNNQDEDNTETDVFKINVALTREVDKNGKLKEMIITHPTTTTLQDTMKINCIELPCIEHAIGPDF